MSGKNDIIADKLQLTLGAHTFLFDAVLPHGKITAVAGPSGAGKSTFLNLLAGFETPDSGRVMMQNMDVTRRHPADRPISLVFQENNLFAHLDLFTNIGLGIHPSLRLSSEDRLRIATALERVGLKGYENRIPGTLSGGERQRAAFARALVRNRPVLLLDEPFAALDPALRKEMVDLLLDLHRESGNTVVLITHNPAEVLRLTDHLVFVENGRVTVSQATEDAIKMPGSKGLEAFLRTSA